MRYALRSLGKIGIIILCLLSTNLWANSVSPQWYVKDANNKVTLHLELFLSSTCPHCHKAEAFFKKIAPTTPWLRVQSYSIDRDKNALIHFNQLLNHQQASDFAIPSLFFCNSRWVGFATEDTTGVDLLHALTYCKQQIEQHGELSAANVSVLRRWANANLFNSGMIGHPAPSKYLILVALMDAFAPCALFSIGAFFALIFMLERSKEQKITGMLFIAALGISHVIQQVYTSAFYESLPWLRWPAAVIGLFVFYLTGQYYRNNRSSPYLLYGLAFVLGLLIQAYQQTCLMNWSHIFQQWLYNQHISNVTLSVYQMLYQIVYLTPLVLTLILYTNIIKIERIAHWRRRLQCIGLLYLMAVGLFLISYPPVFSNVFMSLFVLLSVTVAGLFLSKFRM